MKKPNPDKPELKICGLPEADHPAFLNLKEYLNANLAGFSIYHHLPDTLTLKFLTICC